MHDDDEGSSPHRNKRARFQRRKNENVNQKGFSVCLLFFLLQVIFVSLCQHIFFVNCVSFESLSAGVV
jgi:hypothetical protein